MRRRTFTATTILFWPVVLLAGPTSSQLRAAADGEGLFGLNKVVRAHLEISAEEFQAMQPPMPAGGFGGPPPAPRPKKAGARASERNLFGLEFSWGRGDLTALGRTFKGVGLCYAGNASYMASAGGLKRSFKVNLDGVDHAALSGLRAIHLQSGALDPTRAREVMAYSLFRAAGVPAPRTALAEVTLTVPGRYDKAYLGLYTLVEPVDRAFLIDRFHTDKGLLLKPQGLRGIDFLGDDWEKYKGQYQPQSEPTPAQATRLIEFARLVQRDGEERFKKEIASYLDVDKFLRFMAVQALIANADGFFTLGYNYYLFLDPVSNRFVFMPGEQELAFANFLMMGSADQLMDMSLVHPYTGENRLADRLLAMSDVRAAYRKILVELCSTVFRKDRLLADSAAINGVASAILEREAAARAARAEPPVGFGPPGGPTAPDLHKFAEKRTDSIADQLAGKKDGYRPRFNFGPPRGAPAKPVDDQTIGEVVEAPPGFRVTLFAAPPKVGYPVTVTVAPGGEVFVAVDEQGSLGRTPGGGRVLRCLDDDGDGKADRVNVFARMDHPRGLVAQDGKLWVLHPPFLSVFHDQNGDGVSDRQDVLVSGLTTSLIDERGGDHTTNGIRMGIDGWIYIAVGDYGFHGAKGKDGTTLSQRGGGILRVRPDGTELEVFATGLRNPFAIAIDPYLNLFTRDNTNDGAGWDVRVSHLVQTADYGYSQRFANFPDEIMPPLGAYGQGGGTGALALQNERWPEPYRGALLTGDWGRSEVYRHDLQPAGATFRATQEVFLNIPRPTGMDMGADGRLFVASWRGGEAAVYVGPQVGFIACITPPGFTANSPTHPEQAADLAGLIQGLSGSDDAGRLACQRAIIRRGRSPEATRALVSLASDRSRPLHGRVAALFALKQLDGKGSHAALRALAADASVREFALRALADRRTELDGVDPGPFIAALKDASPRVRAQALIALGRLGDVTAAARIIPLTARPQGSPMPTTRPVQAQPDPDRALPHLALRALVNLRAVDTCLQAIDGPYREGALRALRHLQEPKAVEGLIMKLNAARAPDVRHDILATLVRLYHREADYEGSWWGIRPDPTGPYFDPREWECSPRIASVLKSAVLDGDAPTVAFVRNELARHRVSLEGVPGEAGGPSTAPAEAEVRVVIAKADPKNPGQIGNMTYESAARQALQTKGKADRGLALFTSQSCRACHTVADGQTPRGPHLVDIGKRYSPEELVESILKPNAKIAQGYEAYAFSTADGIVFSGFVVSEGAAMLRIRESSGVMRELKRSEIVERHRQESSAMPEGIAASLTPEQLADLVAYLQSLDPKREIPSNR